MHLNKCAGCNGTGKCKFCNGTGRAAKDRHSFAADGNTDLYKKPCPTCKGGLVCQICKGAGAS